MNVSGPIDRADDRTLSIGEVLRSHARTRPKRIAIISPSRTSPLLFSDLIEEIDKAGRWLHKAGFGHEARVGIAFPNSPEAMLVLVGVLCNAAAVPINPNLTPVELDEQLTVLRLDALVVPNGVEAEAEKAAKRRDLRVIHAEGNRDGTIGISFRSTQVDVPSPESKLCPDHVALVLQTSGTTAVPKLVPRTHANLLAAAAKTRAWFALSSDDLCLCATPFYHAQGVEVNILPALLSGGGTVIPNNHLDVNASEWLQELAPTWFAAGPTLLRRMLEGLPVTNFAHRLRFVASGGAPLPRSLQQNLEDALQVPVLEYYGSSEAGHIASNELPPKPRTPGTCGVSSPDELYVGDETGRPLGPDELGEILVRGPTVMSGYLDNFEANESAFVNGWFRTGDLGRLSATRVVTVDGRVKDIINRGGAKISPAEVDRAMLTHPAVAEAAAFGIPHPSLGEEVAAAVVLRAGLKTNQAELRKFLRGRLAVPKIPRKIVIADELPKGPTGKIQRRRLPVLLAQQLGEKSPLFWEELSPLELEITEIWQRLLRRNVIGVNEDFFDLGGDSLLATKMLLELENVIGKTLPDTLLFEASTIRQLAWSLRDLAWSEPDPLIEVQVAADGRAPLFFFHGDIDGGGYYTRRLASLLGPNQGLIAIAPHKLLDRSEVPSIEQMAAEHLPLLLAAQPPGRPFRLGGYCNGGLVAFETARLLVAAGHPVELVAMVDSPAFNARRAVRMFHWTVNHLLRLSGTDRRHSRVVAAMNVSWGFVKRIDELSRLMSARRWVSAANLVWQRCVRKKPLPMTFSGDDPLTRTARDLYEVNVVIHGVVTSHIPKYAAAPVIHFSAEFDGEPFKRLSESFELIKLPATTHLGCVTSQIGLTAHYLRQRLSELDGTG
jgi:acyl-CoA synthetase (AMP-forming)/AMP-acid ligase II/acyl carrier protein